MNRTVSWWLSGALLLAGAGLLCAESAHPADEAAIRSQLKGYFAARELGDGHAQAMFYTEDADEWGSAAKEMVKGRAALEPTLNLPPDPKRKLTLEPVNITFLSPEVATVDALYGTVGHEPYGHAFYVMVKRDGKWLIRSTRTTRFPVPAGK